jgi:hypothetical protein
MSPRDRGRPGRTKTILSTVITATVAVGSAALIVISTTSSPPPVGDGLANLWVDTDGGTCSRQATAGVYSDAAGCSSFNDAYQAAQSNDVVRVKEGAYAFQTITVASPNKTAPVTIRPETDSTIATVTGLTISGADWVTIIGIDNTTTQNAYIMDDDASGNDPDNNTFEDLDGPWFDIRDGTSNTVSGGDYGPCVANASNGCTARLVGVNQTVDGVVIHDITSSNATLYHPDGIFVRGCTTCVIKNSTFYNNQITNIRVQNCCGNPPNDNLKIYNNWFGIPWANANLTGFNHTGIDVDNEVAGFVIAFNSFSSACSGSCGVYPSATSFGTAGSPAQIYGNLTGRSSCASNTTYSYNAYKRFSATLGPSCGATEVLSADPFPYGTDVVAPGAVDFNIVGSTWLGDEMVPLSLCDDFPTDRLGNSRTDGPTCDAGSVER